MSPSRGARSPSRRTGSSPPARDARAIAPIAIRSARRRAPLIERGAAGHGVAHDRVKGVAAGERLLHEVPAEEGGQRRGQVGADAGEVGQGGGVHVVAVDVGEGAHQAASLLGEAGPGPVDEQGDLGQVVLVVDHAHGADAIGLEVIVQSAHAGGAGGDDGVGDVEGQRVPAEGAGQSGDAREGGAPARDEGGGDGEDQHAGEEAAAGGDHEGDGGAGEGVEQPGHCSVVLVVVEDDEALAAAGEEVAHALQALVAAAGGAEAQGEHVD